MKVALLILAVFLFFFSTSSDAASAPSAALEERHKNRNPIVKPTLTDKTCKEASDCKPLGFGYSCDPSTKKCRKYF